MQSRQELKQAERCVIKVGSALLSNDGLGLDQSFINSLAQQIATLKASGVEVVLVSSGSIAVGLAHLNVVKRPTEIALLQAAAAVGQAGLIRAYEEAFLPHKSTIAQILLTHADIANRERYLNARNTLNRLLKLGVVPIINENDTVATDEIRVGDNDRLASLAANLIDAEVLIILTDQAGLYSADPRTSPTAKLIDQARADDESLIALASGGSALGRGGMVTKLKAAEIAARSGCATLIAHGKTPDIIDSLMQGHPVGTLLTPTTKLSARKQWLANQIRPAGEVVLDEGAVRVIKTLGKSLLPVGVTTVRGEFGKGALVTLLDPSGVAIGRGIANYSAAEARSLCGKNTDEVIELNGSLAAPELIHRDNLALL